MVWSWEFSEPHTLTATRPGTVLGGDRGKVNALKFTPVVNENT